MVVIDRKQNVVTLINTFTVKKENQQRLIDVLNEATETVMHKIDGFVSANIHRGLEGNVVANYAQWASKEHFLAMLQNPLAQAHMKTAAELAEKYEPILYEVAATHSRS